MEVGNVVECYLKRSNWQVGRKIIGWSEQQKIGICNVFWEIRKDNWSCELKNNRRLQWSCLTNQIYWTN